MFAGAYFCCIIYETLIYLWRIVCVLSCKFHATSFDLIISAFALPSSPRFISPLLLIPTSLPLSVIKCHYGNTYTIFGVKGECSTRLNIPEGGLFAPTALDRVIVPQGCTRSWIPIWYHTVLQPSQF